MINLKSILLGERRTRPDFNAIHRDVLSWRQFWFSKIRTGLFHAVNSWYRAGAISEENLDDYVKVIEDMGELLAATGRQANKLDGGGLGVGDFERD